MAKRTSRKLIALSSAAIISIYAVGYIATAPAAASMASQDGSSAASPSGSIALASPTPLQIVTSSAPPAASSAPAVSSAPASQPAASPAPGDSAFGQQPTSGPPFDGEGSGRRRRRNAFAPIPAAPIAPTAVPPTAVPSTPASAAPAPATPASPTAVSQPKAPTIKDGVYTGSGMSRRGGVDVAVTIKSGKITAVRITGLTTHYSGSVIAGLPAEVVAAQSNQIDLVSGATDSSMAFQQAVTQALRQALQ